MDEPAHILQHHIAHSGLHGFLTKSGRKNLANPESHIDAVQKIKSNLANNDQNAAVDTLHNHALGIGNKAALAPIIQNIAGSVATSDVNPESLKSSIQYLHGALRGGNRIEEHANNIFEKQPKRNFDHEKLGSLKNELTNLQSNPEKVLEIADGIGHYLPGHNAEIGAQVSTAINYLNSIKPMNSQGGPLDPVVKPSKMEEYRYNKALDIAEDPLSVIHHAKDGTLEAQDLVTLHTLYPKVANSIMQKATEAMVEKGSNLSMKEKRAVSSLLGEPLMFSQTPQSCQAIMKANAGSQTQSQQEQPKSKSQKATGVQLKEINQVNKLYATPLQERQIDRKD